MIDPAPPKPRAIGTVPNGIGFDPGLGFIYGPRACPAGATELSPGFNPGNPHNKRFALKGQRRGYQMKLAPIAAQESECAIGTCDNWTIGPRFRLVRTFDRAPPSGRVALGGRFQGLKLWAKSSSPCGAQNKDLQPKDCGLQPFRSISSEASSSRHSDLSPRLAVGSALQLGPVAW
jgi:hypothetical protein